MSVALALPVVDDKIGVFAGDAGAADRENPFQTGRFDQSRGIVIGRIAKHRPAVGGTGWLGQIAPFKELADTPLGGLAVARLQPQVGGDKPFIRPRLSAGCFSRHSR